jgi:23S rRNA (guanosine2251-2'-O)-methyltransferase
MKQLILIVHNVRSAHNVGSLLRTADAMAVDKVYLTGFTPYPLQKSDSRPPHVRGQIDRKITKTSLGAEKSVDWDHQEDVSELITSLKRLGVQVVVLEQTPAAKPLSKFTGQDTLALIVGNEVEGLDLEILRAADEQVMIPMLGTKESLNVANAAAIALYCLRHTS